MISCARSIAYEAGIDTGPQTFRLVRGSVIAGGAGPRRWEKVETSAVRYDAPNLPMSKGSLIRLNRAVFVAELLIVQQRAIVARLASRGLNTEGDEDLLLQLLNRLEILSGRRRRFFDYRDRPVPLSYRTKRPENASAEDETAENR